MSNYTADSMNVLEGLNAIRTRPGMYIGGTDSDGLIHLLWEVFDNAVDEHLAGRNNKIRVELRADGSVVVQDAGNGIPPGKRSDGRTGMHVAFMMHGGGKFDQNAYETSGGLNGIGIAAVAACSTRLSCTVYTGGQEHLIEFRKGEQVLFKGDGQYADYAPQKDLKITKDSRPESEKSEWSTGTVMQWWADLDEIFDEETEDMPAAVIDPKRVLERAYNTAHLCPGLTIIVVDELGDSGEHTYTAPNGIVDMLPGMSKATAVTGIIRLKGKADFVSNRKNKNLFADLALQWTNTNKMSVKSFVNIIVTPLGGTHVAGVGKGLTEVIVDELKNRNMMRAKDPTPELVDIEEGLSLVINVNFQEPVRSQTKERLNESPVSSVMRKIIVDEFGAWIRDRANSADSKALLDKVLEAARSRTRRNSKFDASEIMAEANKASIFGKKPEKLVDCIYPTDPRAMLMIVEGDSALGTIISARNADFTAGYPLRGKPLSVYGLAPGKLFIPPPIASPKSPQEKRMASERQKFLDAGHILLQNTELDDLVKILDAGFGDNFRVEDMKYHNVCIVADADVDGGHITALLIAFFVMHMRKLVESGRLYIACPPLYLIEAGSGKNREVFDAANDAERDAILEDLKKRRIPVHDVSRRKGHGESSAQEAHKYLIDPATRRLQRVVLEDAERSAEMLELLFGSSANARKEWISSAEVARRMSHTD